MASITYKEYNEKYRLPEQAKDEELIMRHKHHCLCYEPGKGKSYPVIHCMVEINKLKNGNANVLIMSDATCIKDMWRAEIMPQGILPKNTYMVTDRTAIGQVKEAIVKMKWDLIICDECFHPEVEVLTSNGWKPFYKITNEKVAQYNEDGTIEFVEPIRKIEKDYEGDLHILYSNNKKFRMTPHHMMVYENLKEFAENHNQNNSLIVSGKSIGKLTKLSALDKLAIACQADGCCHPPLKNGTQQWDFKFTKERKQTHLLELLTELNIPYTTGKYFGNYYIKLPVNLNITKDLNTYFTTLEDKSSDWCKDFIYEESLWDGHFDDKNRFYYSSTNENNTRFIETILALCERKFNTTKIIDNRWSKTSISYRVQSSNIIIDSRASRVWETEYYKGKVYCVEVPSHMIIVRSPDGTAIICGNCQSLRSGVTRAKSKYAKLVYALTKRTEYVIGMTGTIAGNNNIEPFCVLHNLNIAGMGEINCHMFKERYCVKEMQYGPFGAFEKPVRLNEAGERIMEAAYNNGCSFWEYDDDDNMPPMEVNVKKFTVPETKTYKDALEGILQCDEFETTVQKAIAMQKAQQALNGFVYYNDEEMNRNTFRVPKFRNPKLDYVIEECKKNINLIAYRFQEDGYYIKQELDKNNIKYSENITDFKKRSEAGEYLMLVLQCSRGKAANLQVCQNIIYYTGDFSFISYKQLIHRCWRRGQEKSCRVTFLVNETGDKYKVEEKIWTALRKKQSIHDALMSIKSS